ncbi:hypothetical protein NDU88_000066 [Pleurodeles waltl]|uniref:Uncharacterized protein n=1 Tax=Pleurodeles waltl TaxID=8319 RepID=A0AAV7S7M7_PLEWA|nr:hypothetical protein NDU88_000066 [Pleurodeles waltl]
MPGPAASGPAGVGSTETSGDSAAGPRPAGTCGPATAPEPPETLQQAVAGQEAERPGPGHAQGRAQQKTIEKRNRALTREEKEPKGHKRETEKIRKNKGEEPKEEKEESNR